MEYRFKDRGSGPGRGLESKCLGSMGLGKGLGSVVGQRRLRWIFWKIP